MCNFNQPPGEQLEFLPSSLIPPPPVFHLQLWGSPYRGRPRCLLHWQQGGLCLQATIQLVDASPLSPGERTPPGWAEAVTTGARW